MSERFRGIFGRDFYITEMMVKRVLSLESKLSAYKDEHRSEYIERDKIDSLVEQQKSNPTGRIPR